MKTISTLFGFAMLVGATAAQASDVLVLPGVASAGDRRTARLLSFELADDLSAQGFSVLTDVEVGSLFAASGCADFSETRVRSFPFSLANSLAKSKTNLVYSAFIVDHGDRFQLRVSALDTRTTTIVARENVVVAKHKLRHAVSTGIALLKKRTKHIRGRRAFAGITGDVPNAQRASIDRLMKSKLRTKARASFGVCNSTSERAFDVVLRVHRDHYGEFVITGDTLLLQAKVSNAVLDERDPVVALAR